LVAVVGKRRSTAEIPGSLVDQPSRPTGSAHSQLRVLLAEDNVINQKVALGQLLRLGYRADAVTNGIEVMEAWNRGNYDMILMDCQMPQLDGYATTRQIRQIESDRRLLTDEKIYIVAMTANALLGDREKCLEAGMDDYISKPFKASELQNAVERGSLRKKKDPAFARQS